MSRRGRDRDRYSRGSDASSTIGKEGATKFKGLFTANDWKCPLCGNINWARRDTCNQCSTSQPGNDSGQTRRDGAGGGYMERDHQVEYKRQHRDYDDEWDEFGRRRKRPTGGGQPSSHRHNGRESKETNVRQNRDKKEISKTREDQINNDNDDDDEDDDDDDDDGRWDAWNDILTDKGDTDEKKDNSRWASRNQRNQTYSPKQDSAYSDSHSSRRRFSPRRSTHRNDSPRRRSPQRRSSRDWSPRRRSPHQRSPRQRSPQREQRYR